ncbi:MAG: hypothetical protein ACM34F_09840 [Betaproteobacteria bacterium]
MKRTTSPSPDAPRAAAAFIAIRIAAGTAALALVAALVLAWLFRVELPGVGASLGPLTAVAQAKQERLRVDSLDELRRTVFFDPVTRKPAVWYSITATGDLHLFAQPGKDPDNGEWLKPATDALVQQLERRLKTQDQERLAEAERRAATARADAEIARARRAPDARSMSGTQRERSPAQAAAPTTTAPETAPVTATTTLPPASTARPLPAEPEQTTAYDALVRDARTLIDAGRYSEARAKAQRALHVDPRRMAARNLWAEAQTRLDETQSLPSASQSRPRALF